MDERSRGDIPATGFPKEVAFPGRIVIIGFGSIGQGVLPLIFRHIAIEPRQITIVTADEYGRPEAEEFGVAFKIFRLTRDNFRPFLNQELSVGDFLLNLSIDVSSIDLMEYCAENAVLYLDTCIEPWVGGYTDANVTSDLRTNYAFREAALARNQKFGKDAATAVITHGANPGLVSHFVKQAILNIAKDTGKTVKTPQSRKEWASLACDLSIKVIHIAERDTQVSYPRKAPGEFVNTWSVDGFVSEGSQPAELGWGTHEKHFPPDGGRHTSGCKAAIYLDRPGASLRVRTWTPLAKHQYGFLITHGEAISIADYFTVGEQDNPDYRPTVHYAYHPCDDAVLSVLELQAIGWQMQLNKRLIAEEITSGVDELGVLLMGHEKGAYWYGSRLAIEQARFLIPYNSATALQVTVSALAGMIWAMKNPQRGVIEPDELPFDEILKICTPYLGDMIGEYSDWTPLQNRNFPFPEDLDESDPWQFKNFRIV